MMKISYKHVLCPGCNKGFMVILDQLDYKVKSRSEYWMKLECPKCNVELLVSDAADEALLTDETEYRRVQITM